MDGEETYTHGGVTYTHAELQSMPIEQLQAIVRTADAEKQRLALVRRLTTQQTAKPMSDTEDAGNRRSQKPHQIFSRRDEQGI